MKLTTRVKVTRAVTRKPRVSVGDWVKHTVSGDSGRVVEVCEGGCVIFKSSTKRFVGVEVGIDEVDVIKQPNVTKEVADMSKKKIVIKLGKKKVSTFPSKPLVKSSADLNSLIKSVSALTLPKSEQDLDKRFKWDVYKQGLTQSLISTFRRCERKFRLSTDGVSSMKESLPLMYGTVFHQALDFMQNDMKNGLITCPEDLDITALVDRLVEFFKDDYLKASPDGKENMELCYGWVEVTLPKYLTHWSGDFFGTTKKDFVEIEKEFAIKFPSVFSDGKQVPVRGKRDGVVKEDGKLWLWENKTKGQWNEVTLSEVVERDLQNNVYLLSLEEKYGVDKVQGVIYNLVRRPNLRRKKSETLSDFIKRCGKDIDERPEFYFARMKVDITSEQRKKFKAQFSRQVSLIERWAKDVQKESPFLDIENTGECVSVYGACPYLGLCSSQLKDYTGLYVKEKLFSELEEANK